MSESALAESTSARPFAVRHSIGDLAKLASKCRFSTRHCFKAATQNTSTVRGHDIEWIEMDPYRQHTRKSKRECEKIVTTPQ
jgi:hypothetical protein